jgi:hypothetical protein
MLGEGATSRVFEVEDRLHQGRFALKQLRRGGSLSLERVARFKDEFRAFQHISHPNLAKNYELISDDSGLYVLMELVDGVDFLRYVRPGGEDPGPTRTTESDGVVQRRAARSGAFGGVLSTERLYAVLPQLVSGLCALHAANKIHCDIKPENVLITPEGRVVILDFGLATEAERKHGARRGTPEFMAPEQFAGLSSEAVDWYAVGVLLYCALSGRLPIAGSSNAIEHTKRFTRPIDPRIQATGLPDNLVDLALRLLEPEPSARPTGNDIARSMGFQVVAQGRPPVPFVGRERELQRLHEALKAPLTTSTGARVLYVYGESGIGKTMLGQRFGIAAEARGHVVLRAGCYMDASVPYKGLDGIVDAIATRVAHLPNAATALDAQDRAALIMMFPVFGRSRSAQPEAYSESDPALLRARAVRALRTLLASLAGPTTAVVWIDDFQWTDTDSIDLLADLLQAPASHGVLWVLAYRSTAPSTPERMQYARKHLPCDDELELGPLDASGLRRILEAAGPIHTQELATIARESGGNPFFASELSRARLAGYGAQPLSLEALLAARTNGLGAGHRSYLELVSIAVRPLDETILRTALAVSQDVALEARRVLASASFVRMADAVDRAVEPYHDRIREHVLSGLSPERSRSHHAALAAAYDASGSADPATLALHYRAAGNPSKALSHTMRAADAAVAALAFDHAADLYDAAAGMADPATARELRIKRAFAISNAGRPSDAARAFVATLSPQDPDIELMLCAGDEFLRAGEIDAGLALVSVVAREIGEPLPRGQATALASLIWNGLKLRHLHIEAHDDAQPASMERRLALCLSIARRLVMIEFVLAARFQLRYLELALLSQSRPHIVQGLALQACFSAQMPKPIAGGVARAEQLFAEANQRVRETDSPLTRGCVMFAPGAIALANGRWRECRVALENVVVLLQEKSSIGLRWDSAFSQSVITQMLWLEGDLQELRRRMHGYLREARGHSMAGSVHVLRGAAMLALCDDRPDHARRMAAETMKLWAPEPWRMPHHFNGLAHNEIDLYEGKPHAVLERLHATRRHSKKAGFHQVSLYLLTDVIVRARTLLAVKRHADAERDIALLRGRSEAWAAAVGGALLGCSLASRGQASLAVPVLRSAIERLDEWELGLFATAARYRLGQLIRDTGLQQHAHADFAQRGVRVPERFIASLLPLP